MPNLARIAVSGSVGGDSPSTDLGYDAVAGEVLTFGLEALGEAKVRQWSLAVYDAADPTSPLASLNAPALTLVGATSGKNVLATNPAANITCTLPAGCEGSAWIIRSKVNGGVDASGRQNPDYVFERIVVVRDGTVREIVPFEGTQYSGRSFYDELSRAIVAAAGDYLRRNGSNAMTGNLNVGAHLLLGVTEDRVTHAALSSNQHDLSVGNNVTYVLLSSDGGYYEIDGFNSQSGGSQVGRWVREVWNYGTEGGFIVKHNGGASSGNKAFLPDGVDFVLHPGCGFRMVLDDTNARWQVTSISRSQIARRREIEDATYTFGYADVDAMVEFTAAEAVDVTVPDDSTTDFPVGTQFSCYVAPAAGPVTVAGESPATIEGGPSAGGGSFFVLWKRAANDWVMAA